MMDWLFLLILLAVGALLPLSILAAGVWLMVPLYPTDRKRVLAPRVREQLQRAGMDAKQTLRVDFAVRLLAGASMIVAIVNVAIFIATRA